MISKVLDVTTKFNADSGFIQELTGWDYCVVQIVTPTGAVSFNTTNNDGSVTGELNPVPVVPEDWVSVQGTNLTTGSAVTSVNATSIVRFDVIGEFLQLTGSSVTAAHVFIKLSKINP